MGQKFLVVDDHPLMRDAIRSTLVMLSPESDVQGACDLTEALRCFEQTHSFDLALLDLHLPDTDGTDGLRALREKCPETPVVVMSADVDGDTILRCIDLGACGYIPKTLHVDGVMNALRVVAAGDIYIPHQAVSAGRNGSHKNGSRPLTAHSTDPRSLGLTDRQLDVLLLILKGYPNKLICRNLHLAEGTIKVHVSAVLRALGVNNRTQAILAASAMGLKLSELERRRSPMV